MSEGDSVDVGKVLGKLVEAELQKCWRMVAVIHHLWLVFGLGLKIVKR